MQTHPLTENEPPHAESQQVKAAQMTMGLHPLLQERQPFALLGHPSLEAMQAAAAEADLSAARSRI